MRVADLMHTEVRVAGLDWTLGEVVQSLADGHVTALPVVDREGRLLGVVSNADVLQAQAEGAESDSWRHVVAEEVMSRPVLTVGPDVEIHAAARQMLYGDVHRLFVEHDGKLAGVLSQTDLVRALALEHT
ncbi:MAG TPA: CBS domain-containing protein [Gemmatimonadales bacterium]|nr:CBS domain-containing protein [Gemmatimonadales bacterium]